MMVPHPRYYIRLKDNDAMIDCLNASYAAFQNRMDDHKESVYGAAASCATAIEKRPDLVAALGIRDVSPIDMRYYTREFLLSKHFEESNGAIIETTSALNEMMIHTDVNDVPCTLIAPPFPLTYFNFSKPVSVEGCNLVIHGAYVDYKDIPLNFSNQEDLTFFNGVCNDPVEGCESVKVYEFVFPVSFIDFPHTIEQQKTLLNLRLGVANNSKTGVLDKVVMQTNEFNLNKDVPGGKEILIVAVEGLLKVMLYMGLKESRIVKNNELNDFKERMKSLGAKKLQKIKSKEFTKYNRIIVGPENIVESGSSPNFGGTKATHIRRGHFRNQRYGEGLKDSHIILIKPVIVNAIKNEVPAPKTYKIKM